MTAAILFPVVILIICAVAWAAAHHLWRFLGMDYGLETPEKESERIPQTPDRKV